MIKLIVACDFYGGIGKDNKLPWPKNKKDLQWFKNNTINNVVVMGRETWNSIGSKPLPNRVNVVVTKNNSFSYPDVIVINSNLKEECENLEIKYPYKDIWIIGGASIYEQCMPFADSAYITIFKQRFNCDRFISLNNLAKQFPRITKLDNSNKELEFIIRDRV